MTAGIRRRADGGEAEIVSAARTAADLASKVHELRILDDVKSASDVGPRTVVIDLA